MRAARSLQFLEKTQVLTVQSWARKKCLRQCNKALVTVQEKYQKR